MSRTFLALLHYDGSRFVGWQRQPAGRSVQAEVERVLGRLAGRRVVAHAAGRTDAGVHALGMPVSFLLPARWEPPELQRALNALLPEQCWVAEVHEMRAGFHARKHAVSRRYRYEVGTDAGCRSPFRGPWEWALGRPLDLAAMQEAAGVLVGEHDFRPFSVRSPRPHYRCRVGHSTWGVRAGGVGMYYEVVADRFLHHMVRMLVGTMTEIGLGRRPVGDMRAVLASGDNAGSSPPAPPQGLFFLAAGYPDSWYVTCSEEA